ncbi:uncharacterized protein UV8b_07295 [Ustilaginoidea virens]|uniref:Uncharacterized protein n=1 Tax=Ustilaginoidea virens TaxID=1159556 RepID=A0A8E5HXK8_USTVR|nr:uncharacterized protein UV8b_07295 [Ustilaginoidea virens]QUC23054.1 hypothetical protein UV8b_07295 [Ustilaginoidea virens]
MEVSYGCEDSAKPQQPALQSGCGCQTHRQSDPSVQQQTHMHIAQLLPKSLPHGHTGHGFLKYTPVPCRSAGNVLHETPNKCIAGFCLYAKVRGYLNQRLQPSRLQASLNSAQKSPHDLVFH